MKILRGDDVSFLQTIPALTAKITAKERGVSCVLESHKSEQYLAKKFDLGEVAINFLYDPFFEQIIGFLDVSVELVSGIKMGDHSLWTRFSAFAEMLFNEGNMHPFYYPVFIYVANAFRLGMRNAAGELLDDVFFVRQADELKNLKERVSAMLDAQDAVTDISDVIKCYRRIAFAHPLPILNVQGQLLATEDPELVMVLCPQEPGEIWNYLLLYYVSAGMRFKRCENCKRFFATTGRGNPKFCERIIEGTGKTCRQLMPKLNFNSKGDKDPAVFLYNRAYKTMYSRVTSKTMTKEMFKEWAKRAREKRDACTNGQITPETYSTWLCDNGLFIDYLKDKNE